MFAPKFNARIHFNHCEGKSLSPIGLYWTSQLEIICCIFICSDDKVNPERSLPQCSKILGDLTHVSNESMSIVCKLLLVLFGENFFKMHFYIFAS